MQDETVPNLEVAACSEHLEIVVTVAHVKNSSMADREEDLLVGQIMAASGLD